MTADIQAAKERLNLDLTEIEDRINAFIVRFEPDGDNWSVRYLGDTAKDARILIEALAEARRQVAERDEAIRAHLCAREALEETPVQRLRPDDERFKAVSDTLAGLRSALLASQHGGGDA